MVLFSFKNKKNHNSYLSKLKHFHYHWVFLKIRHYFNEGIKQSVITYVHTIKLQLNLLIDNVPSNPNLFTNEQKKNRNGKNEKNVIYQAIKTENNITYQLNKISIRINF